MRTLHLVNGQWSEMGNDLLLNKADDDRDILWVDVSRGDTGWEYIVNKMVGFDIHENHLKDALNETHPPKYENCNDYEILILPTYILTESGDKQVDQHTFVFTENTILTITPEQSSAWGKLQTRFASKRHKPPQTLMGMLYSFTNMLVNIQVNNRSTGAKQLEEFQERLLDSEQKSKTDWDEFFTLQKHLNSMAAVTQIQLDTLNTWRSETDVDISEHNRIRINDVIEHLQRHSAHMETLSQDVRNMLQIYFSITQDKTNNTMRVLTVISVIFLPLNLFAGIFGMNFVNIPGLQSELGFWAVLAAMLATAVGLYWILLKLR